LDFDAEAFVKSLSEMTNDELFESMWTLDLDSAAAATSELDSSDILERISYLETEIENRYPGQLMVPYKRWRDERKL
jgi:hypothetical protein